MRRLAGVAAGALLAGAAAASWADEAVYAARVTRVFDADTVWVQPAAGGRWRKLRLDGLDAPEICQAMGVAARDALASRLLERRELRLVAELDRARTRLARRTA